MGRRITDLDDLLGLFDGFEASMYRLETLQNYDVAYERDRYESFLAGGPVDLTPGPWQERIRRHRAAGRAAERVHVVVEPLTEYLQYELVTAYRRSALAGERISLIPVGPGDWPARVPKQDYWLFDDEDLWIMEYDSHGRFVVAEQRTEPTEVEAAVEGKRVASAKAIPLDAYLAASPPLPRYVS